MLPFVLKIADQPVERLQRISAESQSIDVNVQVELYAREINRADVPRTPESRRLILSTSRSHELFEICQMQPDANTSIFHYGGYEITIKPRRHILDTAAYLVAPDKYTLFIRQVREENTIRVYRSDFINLTENSPPPFKLDTRDIIESLQLQLVGQREQPLPIEQLLMFPPSTEDTNSPRINKCPECGGRVRRLGREADFCLECDWDNLPPLRQAR